MTLRLYVLHRHDEIMPEALALALMHIAQQILPIASENKGTWHYLLEFAARISQSASPDQWVDFWEHLVAQDAKSILVENLNHNSDATFWYYIGQAKADEIITRILFHRKGVVRQYGQAFLLKSKQVVFDNAFLSSLSDKRFLVGLLDFSRKDYAEKLFLPFILGIVPRLASVVDTQIRQRCLFSLRLLIVNYPDTLMAPVKQACEQYPILMEPLQAAEQYHESIRQWKNSPVNSILRYELIEVARTAHRRFNEQVRESAYKDSLMAVLCGTPMTIIYGDGFSSTQAGKVTDKTPFRKFSHSFEVPRLPVFNPEGNWMQNRAILDEIGDLEND